MNYMLTQDEPPLGVTWPPVRHPASLLLTPFSVPAPVGWTTVIALQLALVLCPQPSRPFSMFSPQEPE